MRSIISFIRLLKKQHRFNAMNYAAQLSYGILLAFLPAMMVFYSASGFFFRDASTELIAALQTVFPKGMLDFFYSSEAALNGSYASGTWVETNPLFFAFSTCCIAAFIVYAAIRAVRSFMVTSTRVSGFKESRGFIRLWQDAFYNTIVLIALFFSVIYFYVVTQHMASGLADIEHAGFLYQLWKVFSYAYLILMLIAIMTWCYSVFPCVRLKLRQALPGGIFSVTSWLLLINLIQLLQDNNLWPVGLTELTRSVNLMFYIYCFSLILILGAVVNILFIRLNAYKKREDTRVAGKSGYYPDTIIRSGKLLQKGKMDKSLLFKSKHPDLTTKERLKALYLSVVDSLIATNFPGICTQLAFYMLATFVPLILFLLQFVSGFYADFQSGLLGALRIYLPEMSYQYLIEEVTEMSSYLSKNQGIMGLTAFVMAGVSMYSILSGVNQTYGFERYRHRQTLWLKSLLFTLFLALGTTVLMLIYSLSESIRSWIHSLLIVGLPDDFSYSLYAVLFSELVVFLLIMSIYIAAPEKPFTVKQVLPGSIFAVLAISIVFRIYLFFLDRSLTYIALYGSQSGLFILLVVLFFFSCVLNIGAKINVMFSRKR